MRGCIGVVLTGYQDRAKSCCEAWRRCKTFQTLIHIGSIDIRWGDEEGTMNIGGKGTICGSGQPSDGDAAQAMRYQYDRFAGGADGAVQSVAPRLQIWIAPIAQFDTLTIVPAVFP